MRQLNLDRSIRQESGCRQHHIQNLKTTLWAPAQGDWCLQFSAPPACGFLQPALGQASLQRDHIVLILEVKKKQRLGDPCLTWSLGGISIFFWPSFQLPVPNVPN